MKNGVSFKGEKIKINGEFPISGQSVKDFSLVNDQLTTVTLANFANKKKLLNIFPSIDTPVCATSVRKFNEAAAACANSVVLCISADLPFAQARFCGAENLANVKMLSTFRDTAFAKNYGVEIVDSPLSGLTARAIIVLDKDNRVIYSELVSEITQEPNYDAALNVLKS